MNVDFWVSKTQLALVGIVVEIKKGRACEIVHPCFMPEWCWDFFFRFVLFFLRASVLQAGGWWFNPDRMWPLTFAVFRRPVAKGRRRGCLFALFLLFCLFFFWCFEAPSGAFFFSGSARGGRTAPNRTTRAPTRVKSSHSPGSLSLSLSLSLDRRPRAADAATVARIQSPFLRPRFWQWLSKYHLLSKPRCGRRFLYFSRPWNIAGLE